MKATVAVILRVFLVLSVCVTPALAQSPGNQQQQPEFIKQGQQLMREGKLDAALALYRQTLQTSQDSLPANIAAGSVLDLMGQVEEARQYLGKAIQVADTPERKATAQRLWRCRMLLKEIARKPCSMNSWFSTTTGL